MRYIGIDPGIGGGIAVVGDLNLDSRTTSIAVPMPATEQEIFNVLQEMARGPGSYGTRAVLEFVRSSPQMGVTSAFTFGRGYGALRMALVASCIPFDEVPPGKWQAAMGCRSKGDKNVTKRRAQELFPDRKMTHAIADALLLAEYARRLETRS